MVGYGFKVSFVRYLEQNKYCGILDISMQHSRWAKGKAFDC